MNPSRHKYTGIASIEFQKQFDMAGKLKTPEYMQLKGPFGKLASWLTEANATGSVRMVPYTYCQSRIFEQACTDLIAQGLDE